MGERRRGIRVGNSPTVIQREDDHSSITLDLRESTYTENCANLYGVCHLLKDFQHHGSCVNAPECDLRVNEREKVAVNQWLRLSARLRSDWSVCVTVTACLCVYPPSCLFHIHLQGNLSGT